MATELSGRLRENVIKIIVRGLNINEEETERYLGMTIDERRDYVQKLTGKKLRAYEGLDITNRTH